VEQHVVPPSLEPADKKGISDGLPASVTGGFHAFLEAQRHGQADRGIQFPDVLDYGCWDDDFHDASLGGVLLDKS
jgi:hypothetical protein